MGLDKHLTHQWVKSIVVKAETEGIYNDCILPKRIHHEFPGKNIVTPICREERVETIDHLVCLSNDGIQKSS